MTRFVDEQQIEMLFGCSSFKGTDEAAYLDAFAMLKHRHLAPSRWLPRVKAPRVFRFAQKLRRAPDAKRAMLTMPPLLRTYLMMGGWVSDHAVVDCDLNTLHVFTGLEIAAVPPPRGRACCGRWPGRRLEALTRGPQQPTSPPPWHVYPPFCSSPTFP